GRLSRAAGLVSGTQDRAGRPDPSVRAALHYDAAGTIDGYVAYRFSGWSQRPPAIDVIDLIAVDAAGYLALWNFLASIDLVGQVRWANAPDDGPLRYALADP